MRVNEAVNSPRRSKSEVLDVMIRLGRMLPHLSSYAVAVVFGVMKIRVAHWQARLV